jgi:hypothetical protein
MKQLLIAMVAVFVCASLVFGQAVTGNGTSKATGSGTPGVAGMLNGPHDFTPTTPNKNGTAKFTGGSANLCGYCHMPHVGTGFLGSNGPGPLWARSSISTHSATFGVYTGVAMEATDVTDPKASGDDNYSSYCLTCHDGSAMFAKSAYGGYPSPVSHSAAALWPLDGVGTDTTVTVPSYFNMATGGSYTGLSHVHPVNFTYDDVLAGKDVGLYPPGTKKYMVWDASFGAVGRLFNNKVQCSSCHNPHNSAASMVNTDGTNGQWPLLEGSTNNGELCTSCHKK